MTSESQKDWWLAATTAGPEDGTFSRPSIRTRKSRWKMGHTMAFNPQYATTNRTAGRPDTPGCSRAPQPSFVRPFLRFRTA